MIAKRLLSFVLAGALVAATGCETMKTNRTAQGAAVGAGVGALAGALLADGDDRAQGALIGGAIGGALGTGVGYYLQKQKNEMEKRVPEATVTEGQYQAPGDSSPSRALSVTLGENALFAFDSADLTSDAKATLDEVVSILMDPQFPPPGKIVISGHTDNTGASSYNMGLSKRRADAVKNYLIYRGIDEAKLTSIGLGQDVPAFDNSTPEGRASNRRVEIRIFPA